MKFAIFALAVLFVSPAWAAKPMCEYYEKDLSDTIPFETVEKVYETEDQESFVIEKLEVGNLRFEITSGEGFEELLIQKDGETLVRTSWSLDQGMSLSQEFPGGNVFCMILSMDQRYEAEEAEEEVQ